MKTTKKQKYQIPYSIRLFGIIEVEAETYYDAMTRCWDSVDNTKTVPKGGEEYQCNVEIDNTCIVPEDWNNPDATCSEEIDETPPKQIKLFDDEEEEVV